MDIYECKADEFLQGFDFGEHELKIDLESSVEDIEAKVNAAIDQSSAEEELKEKPKEKPMAPVIL